jgi:hypothetical protein
MQLLSCPPKGKPHSLGSPLLIRRSISETDRNIEEKRSTPTKFIADSLLIDNKARGGCDGNQHGGIIRMPRNTSRSIAWG